MAYGQSIYWHSGFGNGGVITKTADQPGNSEYEYAESSLELAGGKMLVVVNRSLSYLQRYLANGSIDATFENAGRSSRYNIQRPTLYMLADGKILMAGFGYTSQFNLILYRLLADGTLDPSYNNGNPILYPMPSDGSYKVDCHSLPDGRIVVYARAVPGYSFTTSPAMVRLQANGTQDATFGSNAIGISNFPLSTSSMGSGISNNRLISGYIPAQVGPLVLCAYQHNGKPDSTFGVDGKIQVNISAHKIGAALTTLPDGRIIVGALVSHSPTEPTRFELRCFTPSGQPDLSFGNQGVTIVSQDLMNWNGAYLIPFESGFNYVAHTGSFGANKITFMQFDDKGVLQTGYGSGGQQSIQLSDMVDIRDVQTTAAGTVMVSGRVVKQPEDFLFVTRMKSNGQPDTDWAAGGTRFDFLATSYVEVLAVKPTADGSLYTYLTTRGATVNTGIQKYLPNGKADTSFGNKGTFAFNNGYFDTLANGGFITALPAPVQGYPHDRLQLQRYLPNGQPDAAFGTNGTKTVSLFNNFSIWQLKTLPGDQVIVYGSMLNAQNETIFYACKLLATGEKDTSFGQNGFVYFSANPFFVISDLGVYPDGRLLFIGRFSGLNNTQKFAMVRLLPNGNFDTGFGNYGYVADSSNNNDSYSTKVLLQPQGHCILVHYHSVSNGAYSYYRQATIRFNDQGKQVKDFGDNGFLYDYFANPVAFPDGRWLSTSYAYTWPTPQLMLQMRQPNGGVDSSFGTNGSDYLPLQGSPSNWYNSVRAGNHLFMHSLQYSEFDTKALLGALLIDYSPVSVTSFTLVDATTDKDIKVLKNGDTLNIADVRGKRINIRANTAGTPLGSVVMQLGGSQQRTQTENSAPYALFGNTDNNYWNWTPTPGNYTLFARAYKGTKASGAPGKSHSIAFYVKDELRLASLSLINADNNRVLRPLVNNTVVDLAYTPYLSVRANPGAGYTESVLFLVNGFYHRVENTTPYAIAADDRGDYYNWSVQPGIYNITAIPFPANDAKGQQGTPYDLWFTVINSKPTTGGIISATGVAPELKTESGLTAGVYPNPLAGEGTLTYGAATTTQLSVVLYDANGTRVQQLFNGKVDGGVLYRTPLNTRHLRAGIYFCRILSADGRMQTVQVVKQ